MIQRITLPPAERVELSAEAAPARLLRVGERVWTVAGLCGVVVEVDPATGAVVELQAVEV
jgi:preprotein translocase subunit YajC